MNTYEELVAGLQRSGRPLFWQGPADERAVEGLEARLGLDLPPSFREFLMKYGGGGVEGELISGVEENDPALEYAGTVWGDTMTCRQDFGLPPHLAVVYFSEEGICWCLDFSQRDSSGECPVVSYSVTAREVDATIAANFLAFFQEYVELRT